MRGACFNEFLASGMHAVVSNNCGLTNLIEDIKRCFCGTDESSIANRMQNGFSNWQGYKEMPEI